MSAGPIGDGWAGLGYYSGGTLKSFMFFCSGLKTLSFRDSTRFL
jgi:hypothetical protein